MVGRTPMGRVGSMHDTRHGARELSWVLVAVVAVFTVPPAFAGPGVPGCCTCSDTLVFNPATGSQTSTGQGGPAGGPPIGGCVMNDAPFCTPANGCDPFIEFGTCAGSICIPPTTTPTVTPTRTPTVTPTVTPTPTPTPTPHNLSDGQVCNDSRQCASAFCDGGICVRRNPAPAVSNRTAVFLAAGLLLAGLWSMRRLARRL
jgi:hypothetical protein